MKGISNNSTMMVWEMTTFTKYREDFLHRISQHPVSRQGLCSLMHSCVSVFLSITSSTLVKMYGSWFLRTRLMFLIHICFRINQSVHHAILPSRSEAIRCPHQRQFVGNILFPCFTNSSGFSHSVAKIWWSSSRQQVWWVYLDLPFALYTDTHASCWRCCKLCDSFSILTVKAVLGVLYMYVFMYVFLTMYVEVVPCWRPLYRTGTRVRAVHAFPDLSGHVHDILIWTWDFLIIIVETQDRGHWPVWSAIGTCTWIYCNICGFSYNVYLHCIHHGSHRVRSSLVPS